jgi:transposase InsO family protein
MTFCFDGNVSMPRSIINDDDRQEIRAALAGLSGPRAKAEAQRWADFKGCHIDRIYTVTKDLRPDRKKRTDSGKRRVGLLEHPGMKTFAELVTANKLDPDQAIEMTRANGQDIPVSLGTARRYLREHGLTRRNRRSGVRPYRRFEADAPGEIYQFDISGVKERWVDLKTRRILHVSPLEVSKNHPNTKVNRVQIWKFVLVDDYSRFKYVRFVASSQIDSEHVNNFLLGAFREMGIPQILYTDNDSKIVSRRMRRAESILNRAFADSGGFKLDQHTPGNPQATGKVEVTHQLVEKFEKYIGACDRVPTLEELNKFTLRLCSKVNWTVHRVTGEMPAIRFRHGNSVMRVPPPEILNSAFTATEFMREVRPDLTFSYDAVVYQLPRNALLGGERNPFVDWVGQKLKFVWPTDADYFVVIGLNGRAYELDRCIAKADRAGEFRTPAESIAQQATKLLAASAKEKKAARRAAGEERIVPGIHVDFATVATVSQPSSIEIFPRKKIETNPELLAVLAPGTIPPSMVTGQLVNRWTAAEQMQDAELLPAELTSDDKAWLDHVFADRDQMLDTELRALLEARGTNPTVREGLALVAAKTA